MAVAQWLEAIRKEYQGLFDNGVWRWVEREAGDHLLRTVLVLKRKFHTDGSHDRYKGRICVDGSSQRRPDLFPRLSDV